MTKVERQNSDEGIRRYEAFLEIDPDNPLLWIILGDLYHETGRTVEGLACFEKALSKDPDNPVARARVGNVMITQHRFAEAERLYRSFLGAEAPDPAVLHNYGMTLLFQRRPGEALEAFRRAEEEGIDGIQSLAYTTYALHQCGETGPAFSRYRNRLPSPLRIS